MAELFYLHLIATLQNSKGIFVLCNLSRYDAVAILGARLVVKHDHQPDQVGSSTSVVPRFCNVARSPRLHQGDLVVIARQEEHHPEGSYQ